MSGVLLALVMLFGFSMNISITKISEQQTHVLNKMHGEIHQRVEAQLNELATNIGSSIYSLEAEIDKNMLNAAYTLYEKDAALEGKLDDQGLVLLNNKTQMSDLYLTDEKGIFTISTEKNSIGMSLYDIWEGYQMLMTHEADILPSDFKIKEETGAIFKFMAIPRADGRGIIESALDAGQIEAYLQSYITDANGLQALYLFDSNHTVLIENLKEGYPSEYQKGTNVDIEIVDNLFSGTSDIKIEENGNTAKIYMPLKKGEKITYVLYLNVDTSPYYSIEEIVKTPLVSLEQDIRNQYRTVFFIISLCIVVAIILSTLIVTYVMKPLSEFNHVLKGLAHGETMSLSQKRYSIDFKELSENLGQLIKRYTNIIGGIKQSGIEITKSQQEHQKQMHNIGHIIECIDQQMEINAARIQDESMDIQALDQLIINTTDHLNMISHLSQELFKKGEASHQLAKEGTLSLNKMNEKTTCLIEEIQAGTEAVKQLSFYSETINQMTSLITEVTKQTKLLSLNASIEAARAGESGKGFGVVAEQIKELAESSDKANVEVVNSMNHMVHEVEKTQERCVKQMKQIMETKNEIAHTSEKLTHLIEVIFEMNKIIGDLLKPVEMGHQNGQEMKEKFNNLNQYGLENASHIEETVSSMLEVMNTLEQLRGSLEEIERSSCELQDKIKVS